MNRLTGFLTLMALVLVPVSLHAADPVAYEFGGHMGVYHQSYIVEKTSLAGKDKYRVKTRRIETTGQFKNQEDEVDCDPAKPSVSGKWGTFEGKVFDEGYEVSGANESVYNLLWAACRGETFKSLEGARIYQGFPEVPVGRHEVKGKTYDLHILAQDVVGEFWAVRKVTLEYRLGQFRARKTAHVFCDYGLPTVTVDGETHELAGTLFVAKPDDARKTGTWEKVWVAACIGRGRYEAAP